MSRRNLSDQQIVDYFSQLENGNESEDGLEQSGSEDEEQNYYSNRDQLLNDLDEEDDDDPPLIDDPAVPNDADPPLEGPPRDREGVPPNMLPATSQSTRRLATRNLLWKKQSFVKSEDDYGFLGDTTYGDDIKNLSTPYQFFNYFFTDTIINKIVEESNLYSVQQNANRPVNLSAIEVRHFIGILSYMSVIRYPNVRLYWSKKYGFEPIIETMTVNRFEKIRQYIHFNNNEHHLPRDHENHDRLHKLRPIIDHLNDRFSSVPLDQRLSVDEQMCATKVGHFMKQYLPNKPHKWGFKLYVICSLYGYAHKFEIYSGEEKNPRLPGEPDLGATGNTVIRLARVVPRNVNHIIYFDNYYTSVPLLSYFRKEGIYCLGTVLPNRLPNSKLPDRKALMKKEIQRGTYDEQVTTFEDVEMSATVWKDNKVVTLLSTYVGAEPISTIARFDKKKREKVNIACPKIIKEYNTHMGGVDLMDSYIGRYKISMRSRKWYLRLFYHLLDMAVINSWLLYKKVKGPQAGGTDKILKLCDFRLELASSLCSLGKVLEGKRGRPSTSSVESELQAKKPKGPRQYIPSRDVRTDNISHWPDWNDIPVRCKMPGCSGLTMNKCEKCKVALCHTKKKNCFRAFHL